MLIHLISLSSLDLKFCIFPLQHARNRRRHDPHFPAAQLLHRQSEVACQSTLCEQPENGVDNESMADKNNMSRWAMVYLAKSMHQT